MNPTKERLSNEKYTEREERLIEILKSLYDSELNEEAVDKSIINLNEIYADKRFRHMYSRFYTFVLNISEDERNLFASNISKVFYRSQELSREEDSAKIISIHTADCIAKLYDHINIEIARVQEVEKHKEAENSLRIKIEEDKEAMRSMAEELKEMEESLAKSRFDIVAILGIFSAIVIAFFGGFNYITAAISAMNNSNIGTTILVISVAGFIVFNTIVAVIRLATRQSKDKETENNWITCINVIIVTFITIALVLYLK